MRKSTTWWRNLGGLMAACVLALLVIAPTISAAACICDERPPAHQTVQTEQKHDSAPCKAACCLGGHCHHGGSLFDAPVAAIATPAPTTAEHRITPAHALTSRSPAPLDQPPRA